MVANDDGTVDLVPSAAAAAAAAQKKLAEEQEAQKASREQNLCLHVLVNADALCSEGWHSSTWHSALSLPAVLIPSVFFRCPVCSR